MRACARLAEMQGKQRRAFKGLALLPVPIGLTLFKGAPAASAAIGLPSIGVPSIGVGATGLGGQEPEQALRRPRPGRAQPSAPARASVQARRA